MTAIGAATAIIVGCVGITPAAGFISPMSAMLLGALAAVPSYVVIVWRPRTRLDETLDVLAAHGVAGLTGILFIGFFAQQSWNGVSDGLLFGNAAQLGHQALAVLVTPAYAFGMTFLILRAIALVMPLRATEHEEAVGMDIVQHGEEAYATGEGAILVRAVVSRARQPVRHARGAASAPAGARPLLDEEDLRVLRQRPERVGHDPLEPVGDLADGLHRRDDRRLHVLGALEHVLGLGVADVGLLEREDRVDELVDEPADLLLEVLDAVRPRRRRRAARCTAARPAGASCGRCRPRSRPRC